MARRAHSTAELRRKLRERAQSPADVEPILADFDGRGWLDDRRFAEAFARYRAGRRYGRHRIARELRQRGVADELIEAALAEVFPAERDERRLIRQRLERRLRGRRPPYDRKFAAKLYAGLLRAGFSSAIIRDELFRRLRDVTAEDFEPDEVEEA
jgi:regulatory protein